MKKILIILVSIIVLIVAAAAILPAIFKDDVKVAIDEALAENINAKVYFDADKFGLTLFKHFPNPTVTLSDFGVVGKERFSKDTLAAIDDFGITIDLFSLFGDKPTVKSLNLDGANINIIVLEDGTANYDIAMPSEDTVVEESTTEEETTIGIDSWTLTNSKITYDDRTLPFFLELKGLNHKGKGDFSLDVFDMTTSSTIESVKTSYDGISYLSGQKLSADITLNMDLTNMKFTFKDNQLHLNDFPLSFNGYFAMPGDDMDMDINFQSEGASIKSLYSLVPAAFTEGYENVKAEGTLSFSGFVKGTMTENTLPAYQVALRASDGVIQYPDLPTALSNINMDMLVDCKDGNIDNTLIDIKQFHLDFGKNPIDMKLLIKNLVNYDMNADIKASLNLGELNTMFPMEGIDMKGLYKIDLQASGIYDSVKQIMPSFKGNMSMENGYIKYAEFPKALENMNFTSSLSCPTGKMVDFTLEVSNFSVKMGEDQFTANLKFSDLVDYSWDLTAKGGLDLAVINDYYPIEGMSYTGKLLADLSTKGKYSDVEAERYDKLPTSGKAELSNFVYKSAELPTDFVIEKSAVAFNPSKIDIQSFQAKAGSSDFNVKGYVSNYMDYVFKENSLLTGKMSLVSERMDLNEWMTGEETSESEDTVAMEVIEVPKNVDFEFASNIKTIYYDNLLLNDASGKIIVRDGMVNMDDLGFKMFNGRIVMNGTYDTRDLSKPAFDYTLSIKDLSIPLSVTAFEVVQAFAPFAQNMDGNFNSDIKISGLLGQDMMPDLGSVSAGGLIKIAQAAVKNSQLVSGINSLTKTNLASENFTLKDVIMSAEIQDGRARVKPFDVKVGDNLAKVEGSIGLDQSLDYKISTTVETGAAGQALNSLISNQLGKQVTSSQADITFKVGGNFTNPKISIASIDYGEGEVKTAANEKVDEEVEKAKVQAEKKVDDKKEEAKQEAEKIAQEQQEKLDKETDKLKKETEEKLGEEGGETVDKTKEEAEKVINNLFKKKKN